MEITKDIIDQKKNWQGNVIKRFDEIRADVSWSPFERNYEKLKNELILPLSKNKVVLEIGCHLGRWTRDLVDAKKIIGVDLYDESGLYIKREFPELKNFEFYKTLGNELNCASDESIDFIFCIDSLTRTSVTTINAYLREISRVIKNDGVALLHIPSNDSKLSLQYGFTSIEAEDIKKYCLDLGFKQIEISDAYIYHGVLLKISKK